VSRDEDAGDELAGPSHWPRAVGFREEPPADYWPHANPTIVHGPEALEGYAQHDEEHAHEVGKAKAPAGPQQVSIVHNPKHGKNPPWLTWGNTQNIHVVGIPLGASISPYVQLVNLRYGRPETWRFFLAAKLLSTSDGNPPVVTPTIEFQVTIGNGFTTFTADFFQTLEFEVGAQLGDVRMCTSVQAHNANTFFTSPGPKAPNLIELIPATDLYIAARLVTEGSIGVGIGLDMSATAMVAPNVHVRPGWHLDIFAGGEERF
jgi:hypothetical protein